jgi:hypothetical protein
MLPLWFLAAGCMAVRADLSGVAAFDPGEAAHPEGQVNVAAGISSGIVSVTAGVHTRESARGFEVNLVPQGCINGPIPPLKIAVGGCLGLTAIGGGSRNQKGSLLVGGPHGEAYVMIGLSRDLDFGEILDEMEDRPLYFLRVGARSGLDVRAVGPGITPYVGGFVGIEVWWIPEWFDL